MTAPDLPVPDHFRPDSLDRVWRVEYQQRAAEAARWARRWQVPAAAEDAFRICLLAIDIQNTFCVPGFELYVAGRSGSGAVDDNRRLCRFIYRNLARITTIAPTLDTHRPLQIFHSLFLVDSEGRHPEPHTRVSHRDVESGVWRPDPRALAALGLDPDYGRRYLQHYSASLERSGRYDLTVWPYHALLGGIGHALVSAVEEAIFFHAVARRVQPRFEIKGDLPLTESYSALGPEVLTGPDGDTVATRNQRLLEEILAYDAVVIAGQAKSHCVAWTVADLLARSSDRGEELASRVYLLEDCTSPVVVPGVIDYSDEADRAFERFAAAGMQVVRSTEPMAGWPGMGTALLTS